MKMFTAAEAKKLDELFSKVPDRDDALFPEELHGFLYGLALTPEPIMPSEWYPDVFGAHGPVFESEKDAQTCMGHLMKAYNRIISESNIGKLRFPFDYKKMTNDDLDLIEGWCYGLFLALSLRPHIWGLSDECENIKDEDLPPGLLAVIEAFEVITAVALPEERDEIIKTLPGHPQKTEEEIKAIIYGMLPTCVQIVQEYGEKLLKERRSGLNNAQGSELKTPFDTKVGRNELCPCGSGKKYKKCCGAN